MFELTEKEIEMMVSQNVIPSKSYLGGASPLAFTEQGVTMLCWKQKKTPNSTFMIFVPMRGDTHRGVLFYGHEPRPRILSCLFVGAISFFLNYS